MIDLDFFDEGDLVVWEAYDKASKNVGIIVEIVRGHMGPRTPWLKVLYVTSGKQEAHRVSTVWSGRCQIISKRS